MTKEQFLDCLRTLYREANFADSERKRPWQKPGMSQYVCRGFDAAMTAMLEDDVITAEEHQLFYDNI